MSFIHLRTSLAARRYVMAVTALLAACSVALAQARPAHANFYTLQVTSTADPVAPGVCNPTAGTCSTLRAAIDFANGLAGANQVTVMLPPGTYSLSQGQLQVTSFTLMLDIRGAFGGTPIIERASSAPYGRVLSICNPNPTGSPPCLAPGPTVNLANLAIMNGLLVNTTDGAGAGIRNGGTLQLMQVTVTGNAITADDQSRAIGAGIFSSGNLSISTSTISNNSITATANAGTGAAGIASRFGDLTVMTSTVTGNTGLNAAGGIESAVGGLTVINNSTVSGNSAPGPAGRGGGISTFGPGTHFSITADTITHNTGTAGGGIFAGGAPPQHLDVATTIVANNSLVDPITGASSDGNCGPPPPPPPGPPPPGGGPPPGPVQDAGDNLDSGHTCGFSMPSSFHDADPRLGPLQDNGGPTLTQALLFGSPAIDAVVSHPCPPPSADQRGVTRPQGPRCDIGSFELPDPLTVTGNAITATEGLAFNRAVASMTDTDPAATPAEYSATIAWADGSSSSGVISGPTGGPFTVSGSHTYAEEGTYAVHVTVTDVDYAPNTAAATSNATVADAQLTGTGTSISAKDGVPFTSPVASFTDADPGGMISDFSATISWGDRSNSAGTIAANLNGSFSVVGTHRYRNCDDGNTNQQGDTNHQGDCGFTITVTIADVGGSRATVVSNATVH